MTKARILEIIIRSQKFTVPSQELNDLTDLSFQNRPNANKICTLVSNHSDKLLKICKSDFYSFNRKVSTIKELIPLIGCKGLRNLQYLFWILDFTPAGDYDSFNYSHARKSWILSAVFAHTLSKYLHSGNPGDLFLQACLQDISQLALARCIPEAFGKINKFFPSNPPQEKKEIGIEHSDLSACLLSQWGFPNDFIEPVKLHHQVENGTHSGSNLDPKVKNAAQIILFSGYLANSVTQHKDAASFTKLEMLFNRFFQRDSQELPFLIRNGLNNARDFVQALGVVEFKNFSSLRILKDNPEFLQRRLIPYKELLDELIVAYRQIETLEEDLEKQKSEIYKFSFRDLVSGAYHYSYFQECFKTEIAKSIRYEFPTSLLILDIDGFELFNNLHGFQTGNSLLKQICKLLEKILRSSDPVFRYGGDEFAILLTHTGKVKVNFIAERVRKTIMDTSFSDPVQDVEHRVTVSIGYTACDPRFREIDKNKLLKNVLKALEYAKQDGGNTCQAL